VIVVGLSNLPIGNFSFSMSIYVFFIRVCFSSLTANVLGVWRSGFDLEAGTVNLAQN
jgi:hypothetical protein